MKKILANRKTQFIALAALLSVVSCTKLEEDLRYPLYPNPATTAGAPSPSSLSSVYNQLNQLLGQGNAYAMQEHTTDELLGPTRGTDWDDFGTWRKLHLHTWDGAHNQINDTWNGLNGALFQSTLLAETASGQTQAEAKFLRAFFTFYTADLFGQVQHRAATATVDVLPDVYTRSQACDFVISELESIISALPAYTPALRNKATKEAAWFLLAKMYLNKAVYKQDPNSPAGPFTFAPADMSKVITYCNLIATNTSLAINDYYWDNFKWDNGTKSTENIFVRKNSDGINVVWASCMGNHYNQPPDGWNGFTTLAEFYDRFDAADVRRQDTVRGNVTIAGANASVYYPGSTTTSSYSRLTGRGAGFLVDQQRGPSSKHIGNAIEDLKDRSGNPLKFTKDVSLFFSTETKGIRTNKYPLDPNEMNGGGWGSGNEYVFFRLSDARLMKAEAILRGGTDPLSETAKDIVNGIRAKRNVANLASVDLTTTSPTSLLQERGRELYLEAWRRNDMVRFGNFNKPVGERPNESPASRVVFPIPNIALSSNPNLHQNVGY